MTLNVVILGFVLRLLLARELWAQGVSHDGRALVMGNMAVMVALVRQKEILKADATTDTADAIACEVTAMLL